MPVPGGVKTRLQPTVGMAGAARLAASMLVDRLKIVDELKNDTGHNKLLCGDRHEVTPFLPYLAQAWGQPLWRGRIKYGQAEISESVWSYRSQGVGGLGQRIFRVLRDYRRGGCIVIGTKCGGPESRSPEECPEDSGGGAVGDSTRKGRGLHAVGTARRQSGAGLGSSRGASEC